MYIAKNNGPRDEDAEFAERLQNWLNLPEDEESVPNENNEFWKALLSFWKGRTDFYSTKAPSWANIESHKDIIEQHFQDTNETFDSDKFNQEWNDAAELLPLISTNAWLKYLKFWKRPTRQFYSSTTPHGCPVWVREYCTCIFHLEMLAMPRSMWNAMVEFRELNEGLNAKHSVKITLVKQLELPKDKLVLDKDAIANVLKDMEKNEEIDTREVQKQLTESTASTVYLHCELQMLLLFCELGKKANLEVHTFIGCSKLSCHMCWEVLKNCMYRTRGTHRKISANWSFLLPFSLEGIVKTFTGLHFEWQELFRQYPDCNFPIWPHQMDTNPAATERFELDTVSFKFFLPQYQKWLF